MSVLDGHHFMRVVHRHDRDPFRTLSRPYGFLFYILWVFILAHQRESKSIANFKNINHGQLPSWQTNSIYNSMSLLILLINKLKPCIDFKILPVFVELNTDFSIIVSPQGLILLMITMESSVLNHERAVILDVVKVLHAVAIWTLWNVQDKIHVWSLLLLANC